MGTQTGEGGHVFMRRLTQVIAVMLVVGFALGGLALFAAEVKREMAKPAAKAGTKPAKGSVDVKDLQGDLQKLGYDPGPADGMLGSKTRAALRTFQQDNGLKADGKPRKATIAKLEAMVKAKR
jgi:peptidoglycan hydrolase-like protein with peptidoglycan-binding domain